MRPLKLLTFMILAPLALAACAPENLDITPSPVPTEIPTIQVYLTGAVNQPESVLTLNLGSRISDAIEAAGGAADDADLERVNLAHILRDGEQVHVPRQGEAVAESTPEPVIEATAEVSPNQALLDKIVAALPDSLPAGAVNWRRGADPTTKERIVYRDEEGGVTAKVFYTEPGGGYSELTFGVFDTPEAAETYFNIIRDRVANFTRLESREGFPTPNAFGSGTYGSDAIFVRDALFLRVSVPRFSGTTGDPLGPYSTRLFRLLDEVLQS